MTLEPSRHTHTHTHTISASISFAGDSPAKISALPTSRGKESTAVGLVFGMILQESFAQFSRDGWSSKTCQRSLIEDYQQCLVIWPKSGSMLNGIAYRHPPLVRRTDANECGLLPTPTVQDASNNAGPSQFRRNSLPLNAAIGGALNPNWIDWLMGFPVGWTDLDALAMPLSPRSLKSSGARSCKRKQ